MIEQIRGPLRISLVILSKHFGGAERHVLDLANELSARDFDIQLIVRSRGWMNESVRRKLGPSIQINCIPPILKRWSLKRALDIFAPDIVHSHLGMASRLVSQLKLDMPIVATLHGRFKAKDYGRHNALICVAPWQRETIPEEFDGIVSVIPNFLGSTPLQPDDRTRIRRSHGIPDDASVVGSIGRFSREKGFDVLIKAFQHAAIPNSRLLLVGDGPEMPALRAMASAGVVFAGWQNEAERYYSSFDLFVSPSRAESFGLTTLQAMQSGTAIITTATEGPVWLLGKDSGLIVPIDDVESMAQAIEKLATDVNFRTQLSTQAKRKGERFRPGNLIPEIINFYQRLIGQPS
ncbi:MAG: hypothetical protein A3K04_05090 [Gallionellales bacterium RBG_16_56_9]|nr:MAG: hypothetical protein A3K04_05090 [Gallionellales bacterium RBG_16_56_9]